MQAWQYTTIKGTLENSLTLNEKATPPDAASLPKGHVLVEVISAGVNPVDYKIVEVPIFGRLMSQPPASPGLDFCGRVHAKHPADDDDDDDSLAVGQLVFGALSISAKLPKFGSLGQIMLAPRSHLAALPEGVLPDDAAAVGTAGLTAFQSLPRDLVKPGAKIFINGGSGGVGSFAVQFAKVLGAHVTTTSSTANVPLCRSLGADEIIDYRQVDVVEALKAKGQVFDLAVDNVGTPAGLYEQSDAFLKPGGTFIQIAMPSMGTMLRRSVVPACLGGPKRLYRVVTVSPNQKDLDQIGRWMAEGKVRALIDEKLEWEDAPKAFEKVRGGRTKGKIVVHVSGV